MNKYFIFIALLVLLLSISSTCAEEIGDNSTLEVDESPLEIDNAILEDSQDENSDLSQLSSSNEPKVEDSSDVIVVNNWEELKDYAGRTDKNYVVKLKENTNFYPNSLTSISDQIRINNNLTIIGSNGSYIGDNTPNLKMVGDKALNGRFIQYAPIVVPDDNGVGVTVENVTFKWIYNAYKPDAVFFTMGGNSNNTFKNCVFKDIELYHGHSCIVYIKKGDATLENCSFVNCTTDFGCVSIYNKDDDPYGICTSARMVIRDCYFENNYARTEPGCVNNCGVAVIYNTTFINNRAFWWAGAIHTHGGANTTIYNCEFTDNVAGWNGGALYTYSWLQVYNSTFRGNKCYTNAGGGAIGACKYLNTPKIYIVDSLFEDNSNLASNDSAGGAISIMDEGSIQVYNSTFIKNYATVGTAIKASAEQDYGTPSVIIEGNKFINHTYPYEVIQIFRVEPIIANNYFLNDGIAFSTSFNVSQPIDEKVNVTFNLGINNPLSYDSNLLDKCTYDIYIDGIYEKTISENRFTVNFEDVETHKVSISPSFSIYRSSEITISVPRDYIYVSKTNGNDNNDGLTKQTPVYSLSKAIELAKSNNHILLMDGAFNEENLNIDYRLTIWGTNESSIGESNLINSMFNVKNTKFSLRNLTIKNIESASKLINSESSRIFLDNCIVESNTFDTFIVTEEMGITNTAFKNNKIFIEAKDLRINNATFDNNTNSLFGSDDARNWTITESLFVNNNDLKTGLFNYTSTTGTLKIEKTIFENNTVEGQSYLLNIKNEAKLAINSSIFENNNITIINKHSSKSSIIMRNSILLNNVNFIYGDFNNVDCDYNWWGNTYENMLIQPVPQIDLKNWLFLNIDCLNELEHGIEYEFKLSLDNLITKEGNIISYDKYQLPQITFRLYESNITIKNNTITLSTGHSKMIFSLSGINNGSITTTYGIVSTFKYFNFIKTNPKRTITANDIMVEDIGNVRINLPKDARGNIRIQISNITETKLIANGTAQFDLKGLSAGNYKLFINYSGDKKFESFNDMVNFTVKKYDSTTTISIGKEIKVNRDVIITIEVSEGATGNITLIINNNETNLNISDSKSFYTIRNITRGDWEIKAIYNGDYKYESSEAFIKFEVEKVIPDVIVNLQDINYGENADIQIFMDNDATGNITATIDDIIKTKELKNGRTIISISNLTAGYKTVKFYYTGDKVYISQNFSAVFYIEQLNTEFNISAYNAKEGKNIIVDISIPKGVTGNFTINVDSITEIIPIPSTGEVTWHVSTLPSGNYTLTAIYAGQNYKTCKKSIEISVLPWETTQWPNEGYDGQNTGKSSYESNTNGNISWISETNEKIIGNIAIDSEGNICIVTSSGIYLFDKNGNQKWKFNSNYNSPSGIAIGREVIVYPVSGDTLYFINQTSGEKYGNSNIWKGSSIFTPIIDGKGNIYISGEKIYDTGIYNLVIVPYEAWEYGGQVISIDLGVSAPTTAPLIVNDNVVCVGTEDGLKFIDVSSESVISTLNFITNVRPVVGDGGIVYTLTSDKIIAIDSTGVKLWESDIKNGEAKYLTIDNENGLLYSINNRGYLYKYDILSNGIETLVSNLTITSGLLIGNDGTLYVGVNSTFIALDSNGKYLWKSDLGKTITGTPVMDAEGNIYLTGNTTLFAITNAPLKAPTLDINAPNVKYGDDLKVTVNLDKEATGTINVNIDGGIYSCEIIDGLAEITIPNLATGNHNITISYSGDKRYSASEKIIPANISKVESNNDAISIPNEIDVNNPSFSINLSSDATGTLTVEVDGTKYSAKLENGSATVNVPKLSSGNHNIVVSYSGDENYAPITTIKTVSVPSPKLINNKNIIMDYNDGSSYKVQLIDREGKIVVGDYVTFNINRKNIKVKTDNNGYASVVITETPKTYTITANYNGVSVKNTVTVKQILKSSNFKVKKTAKKLVLKATLKSSKGKAIKGKHIIFKFNGKTYKAKTNKKGIAKVTIKKKVIKKLKAKKKYALQISYFKDTIKKTVSVKK